MKKTTLRKKIKTLLKIIIPRPYIIAQKAMILTREHYSACAATEILKQWYIGIGTYAEFGPTSVLPS